jgi:hypothetical protein
MQKSCAPKQQGICSTLPRTVRISACVPDHYPGHQVRPLQYRGKYEEIGIIVEFSFLAHGVVDTSILILGLSKLTFAKRFS